MIIGITGTSGAGKGTVAEYLVRDHGFKHYSVRAFLNEELARRGISSDRDALISVANDLRARYGPGYISETIMGEALAAKSDAVIESIRSIGEAQYLRARGARLWAVDADIELRYTRITSRLSETDRVLFEKFRAEEEQEYVNEDVTKQNLRAVIALADVLLYNDSSTQELFAKVEEALNAQ